MYSIWPLGYYTSFSKAAHQTVAPLVLPRSHQFLPPSSLQSLFSHHCPASPPLLPWKITASGNLLDSGKRASRRFGPDAPHNS